MSHPQPPQRQPTQSETINYAKAVHTTAVVSVICCPLLALLPPRKLDFYTFGLAGVTVYSANHLVRVSSGRSILQHLSGASPVSPIQGGTGPIGDPSREQEALRQQRIETLRSARGASGVAAEIEQRRKGQDWIAERDEEVKEALDEGKGLADMIMDQVWEVWNWGKTKDDED